MTVLIILGIYAIALTILLAIGGHSSRAGSFEKAERNRPERLLVIGATGGTGKELVAQALERGYEVTALARDPATLDIEHSKLAVVKGDVLDIESVRTAVEGHDAVLCALGHKRFFYPTRILSQGTKNVIDAMRDKGARRLVCETSLGIGNSAGRMGLLYTLIFIPFVLHFYFWDKTRQERVIAASDLDWIIVRPAQLTNGTRRGHCRAGRNIGNFFLTVRITRADVASFMLDQLEDDQFLRAAVGVRALKGFGRN